MHVSVNVLCKTVRTMCAPKGVFINTLVGGGWKIKKISTKKGDQQNFNREKGGDQQNVAVSPSFQRILYRHSHQIIYEHSLRCV